MPPRFDLPTIFRGQKDPHPINIETVDILAEPALHHSESLRILTMDNNAVGWIVYVADRINQDGKSPGSAGVAVEV